MRRSAFLYLPSKFTRTDYSTSARTQEFAQKQKIHSSTHQPGNSLTGLGALAGIKCSFPSQKRQPEPSPRKEDTYLFRTLFHNWIPPGPLFRHRRAPRTRYITPLRSYLRRMRHYRRRMRHHLRRMRAHMRRRIRTLTVHIRALAIWMHLRRWTSPRYMLRIPWMQLRTNSLHRVPGMQLRTPLCVLLRAPQDTSILWVQLRRGLRILGLSGLAVRLHLVAGVAVRTLPPGRPVGAGSLRVRWVVGVLVAPLLLAEVGLVVLVFALSLDFGGRDLGGGAHVCAEAAA
jgi:hypothetical protein